MIRVDPTDRKLLEALQKDARATNQELAEQIGLSSSPCWRRVRQLEEKGVISGYVTLLDPSALGLSVIAYAHVSLSSHHPDALAKFETLIRNRSNVQECYAMSGESDYLLRVVSPSMKAYFELLTNDLLQTAEVQSVNTSFVLQQEKYTTALPLDQRD